MPSVVNNVLVIKNSVVRLTVGRNIPVSGASWIEYSDAIDSVGIDYTFETLDWKPISGNNQSQVSSLSATATFNIAQDLKTGSLYLFLLNNHGALGQVEFFPAGGTTPKVAGNIVISAPKNLGGKAGEITQSTVEIKFDGVPTITATP